MDTQYKYCVRSSGTGSGHIFRRKCLYILYYKMLLYYIFLLLLLLLLIVLFAINVPKQLVTSSTPYCLSAPLMILRLLRYSLLLQKRP